MHPRWKIALSVLFIALVAFFVARAFWPKPEAPKKPPVKVAAKKKAAPKAAAVKKAAPPKPASQAEMAIILDDWGQSGAHVDEVVAIGRPLTLAVIPHLRRSSEVAEQAHAHGLGVMLHMPMQPRSNRQPKEPHVIGLDQSEKEIVRFLDEALASIPHVEGVNNHQGSAATSDLRVMRVVLGRLKEKGLFFVDSKVIASSVCDLVAQETGIRFASRDVFIDNVAKVEAVKERLREAVYLAHQRGRVVVIGHDKLATLEAIRQMVPYFDKNGVKLVLARELVEVSR